MDEEKDELYSPLEKGGLLKQQGVELSYRRTKKDPDRTVSHRRGAW